MIEEVKLDGWKAYDTLSIAFRPGINFITGPNGIGKTSILEAISFAISGSTSQIQPLLLIRKGKNTAHLQVSLNLSNNKIVIQRLLHSNGAEECKLEINGELIKNRYGKEILTNSECSQKLEDILQISTLIFQNIIYMPERDVNRFLNKNITKGLISEIEKVLKLDILKKMEDNARLAVNTFRKQVRETKRNERETLNKIDLDRIELGEFTSKSKNVDDKLAEINDSIKKKIIQINEIESNYKSYRALQDIFLDEKFLIELGIEKGHNVSITHLQNKLQSIKDKISSIKITISIDREQRDRSWGEIDHIYQILGIIKNIPEEKRGTQKCPVCKKSLSEHETKELIFENEQIIESKKKIIEEIEKEIKNKEIELETLDSTKSSMEKNLILIKDFMNKYGTILDTHEVEQQIKNFELKLEELRSEEIKLNGQKKIINFESKQISERIGELKAKIDEVETKEMFYLKMLENAKRELVTEMLNKSLNRLIESQRNEGMIEVYKEISLGWANFLGLTNCKIILNDDGLPVFYDEKNYEYQLEQLSGGEKTALLVITHAILAKHFAGKTNFILLDEPLEHLDRNNRRSLIKFLVDNSGSAFEQLIVTTFEDTLIRKYIDNEKTTIISLETPLKNIIISR